MDRLRVVRNWPCQVGTPATGWTIEHIKINAASVSKGDVAYTIRISDDNFKTYQDFWHLLRSVNGEWICVEHYAVGIEDDYEFYER